MKQGGNSFHNIKTALKIVQIYKNLRKGHTIPARLILSTSSLQTSSIRLQRWLSALLAPLKASAGGPTALLCQPLVRGTQSGGAAWVKNKIR